MDCVGDPVAAAELAAEAMRAVNRLTLGPPSPGEPGWSEVGDLYRVIGGLRVLLERLPQAFGQLARHLAEPGTRFLRTDGGTPENPEALVAIAVMVLNAACDDAGLLRPSWPPLRSRSRTCPRSDTVRPLNADATTELVNYSMSTARRSESGVSGCGATSTDKR